MENYLFLLILRFVVSSFLNVFLYLTVLIIIKGINDQRTGTRRVTPGDMADRQ